MSVVCGSNCSCPQNVGVYSKALSVHEKGGVRCGMRSVGEFQRKNLGWLGGEIAQKKRGE